MNKFIHTTIKLSFLSVIISMTALLNTAPIAGATTQTAHNGQSVVDNRLINPEIGIHITVDDVSKDYYVPMGTVSNALNYLNISLSDDDILNADLSDTVYLGQEIKIDRVNYACYPIYKSIPYKTVEQESDKLFVGQTKMLQKGKPGSTEYIYKDKYVNGELISHKCIKQQVLTYPTDKIIVKGMGYVGSTANRSQNAVNAVKYIFDDNNLAVRHRLFYMCTKDYYDSTPGNFHSTQSFILQYENVLFFDRWQKK